MERNVFLYWTGNDYKLINILRNLIYLHSTNGRGYSVKLINRTNVKEYVPDIPEYFDSLLPAHQADYIRVYVIYKYGGIWLDSDTLVLGSLDSLFDIIEKKDGFFIKENNKYLWNGVFGSKPQTPLMCYWKDEMINILTAKKNTIEWAEIGITLLENINEKRSDYYSNYTIFNGLDTMYPVNWNMAVKEYINSPYDNYKNCVREYQPLLVLVNSVYKELEKNSEQHILQGTMPLNYFLNKSIEHTRLVRNTLYNSRPIYSYDTKDYISSAIMKYRCWEPTITSIFNCILKNKPDGVVLDIGCNIGYYSIISSSAIKHVYAIDANMYNIKMLNMSCKLNNIHNISALHTCIADDESYHAPGNKDIVDKNGNIGALRFVKTSSENGVKSTTIDRIINEHSIENISIMKIDVGGGELNVLKGSIQTLKTSIIKNIIVEISPKFNDDSSEILELLKNNNYTIYNIPHQEVGNFYEDANYLNKIKDNPISDIDSFVKSIGVQTNVLAIKCIYNKFIIITDWIKTYLTQEAYIFAKKLEILGWSIIELSKLDLNAINTIKNSPSIVLCITYDDYDISVLKSPNTHVIYKIDDLLPYKEIRKTSVNAADIIIGPYRYLFNTNRIIQMYPNINTKPSFHIPYSAVNNFYSDIRYNNNPLMKILVSGAIDNVYPLRTFIKTDARFKKYIDVLEHPSYKNLSHTIVNKKYYEKLNTYICCFTDASSYRYILLKVFEICSVGSLLLTDDIISDELKALGFYDSVNCILCNKGNLEDKIKWILDTDNRDKIDEIRTNGMILVREIHTTKKRASDFNSIINTRFKQGDVNIYKSTDYYKNTFSDIYKNQVWNDKDPSVPLSGPGSSLNSTVDISKGLHKFIYEKNCKSVLDLGCGDLTWIKNTKFFKDSNVKYTGVDIVEMLITKHIQEHHYNSFICTDIINYIHTENSSLIIIRNVIFHLKLADILRLFINIKDSFDYIAITSCNNTENNDILNKWHFSERNLHIPPFNISPNSLVKIDEPKDKRVLYIYSHDAFYTNNCV